MSWTLFPLTLVRSVSITPTILHLELQCEEPLEYTPGQFLNIHFENDGKSIHRSYSIANPPNKNGILEIAVSPVEGGRATELLFGLSPGDRIDASGPYGRFVLREDAKCRYVLVGTSTGVTPYRAMLPELRDRIANRGFNAELLIGVWNPDELLYQGDFLEAAKSMTDFNVHACYSRVSPEQPGPHEYSGYVQTRFDALELNPERDIVYLCGNPNMVDTAFAYLKDAGFKIANVRREKYLAAKT